MKNIIRVIETCLNYMIYFKRSEGDMYYVSGMRRALSAMGFESEISITDKKWKFSVYFEGNLVYESFNGIS